MRALSLRSAAFALAGCLAFILTATTALPARADTAAREAYEKQMQIEDQAAEQAGKDFEGVEQKLRADNKAEMRAAEQKAEAFMNSRGERGLSPVVVEKSSIEYNDETGAYDFTFHYEIEYRNRLGEPQKVAVFDQAGNLVSFEDTPYSNANTAVRAHTPRNLTDRSVDWVYARDADGNTYPTMATVSGREGEEGRVRVRVKLWFNEDGIPYKGETFGPDGKRSGGFLAQDDMAPKVGDPEGPLNDVPVPRIVTQPCEKCRDLAERRNAIAHEATEVARLLNETAREQRKMHNAAVSVGNPSQAATALRLKYETNLPRYQALMRELDAAHAAFMACEKTCVPPRSALQGALGTAQATGGPSEPHVAIAPSLFAGDWEGPRFIYLGVENAALVQRFNVEGLRRSDDFAGYDLHAAAVLSRASAVHFGVTGYDVSFYGVNEMFDPLGQDLLFAGVTSGGFSLTAGVPEGTPGGFNVAENMRYAYNQDNTTFYGLYSHACDHGPFTLIGYGGLSYTRANQWQRLNGDIPGFGIDFAYDTWLDTDVVRATVGTRTIYNPPSWDRFSVYGSATGFLNFADVNGIDSLQLGGVFEERAIGKSETTFSWTVGLGAEYKLDAGFSLFGEGRYTEDDTTPVAVRHDDGPSRAEFERSKAFTGRLGARFTF